MIIKAHTILCMNGERFSPGVIHIKDNLITYVGPDENELLGGLPPSFNPTKNNSNFGSKGPSFSRDKNTEKLFLDWSNHVVVPGFVNAHCHLELTALGALLTPPSTKALPSPSFFTDWIECLVTSKKNLNLVEIVRGLEHGISSLMKSGVTCVCDHISDTTPYEILINSPLKGLLIGEVLGLEDHQAQQRLALFQKNQTLLKSDLFQIRPAPHSPYALSDSFFIQLLQELPGPLSVHLAESHAEELYFSKKEGPLKTFLKKVSEITPHQVRSSTLVWLSQKGVPLEKLLLVHANHLTQEDISIIKKHHLSLVHCPRSHDYFHHQEFPLKKLIDQSINVALGTDSLASNWDLNFLNELRYIKQKYAFLDCETLLRMATINGAKALRIENQIGSIEAGKKADLAAFKMTGSSNPYETIFSASQVDQLMIEGVVLNGGN